jgi:ketosteroid isomerase-like protein
LTIRQNTPAATRLATLGAATLFAALLASCDSPGHDPGDSGSDGTGGRAGVPAAEAAIDQFFAAINARDTDRVLAHYHQGDDLVQVACTEVRRGYGRIASMTRMWQEDQADIAIQHRVVRAAAIGPDAAVVAAQGRNQDGLALFWTFVLEREGRDRWLIVQEHQSWADCREPRVHPMGE